MSPPSREEEEDVEDVGIEDMGWMPLKNGVQVRPHAKRHEEQKEPASETREALLGVEAIVAVDEEERRRGKRQAELLSMYEDSDDEVQGETMGQAIIRANR